MGSERPAALVGLDEAEFYGLIAQVATLGAEAAVVRAIARDSSRDWSR